MDVAEVSRECSVPLPLPVGTILEAHARARMRVRAVARTGSGDRLGILRAAGVLTALCLLALALMSVSFHSRPDTAPVMLGPIHPANQGQGVPWPDGAHAGPFPAQGYPSISVYGAGLPANVTAQFTLASFGPNGGEALGGGIGDGFDFGASLSDGTWTFLALPVPGYIPYPASGTLFVTGNESISYTQQFIPAVPCFQIFTEVGLPIGSVWWVIEGGGLGFFSNGTTIDTVGCGSLSSDSVGSATDYQVIAFPSTTYYPGGASVPVAFGPPASSPEFPTVYIVYIVAIGAATGLLAWLVFRIGNRGAKP